MNFVETYRSLTKIPEPNFCSGENERIYSECAYPDEKGGAEEKTSCLTPPWNLRPLRYRSMNR